QPIDLERAEPAIDVEVVGERGRAVLAAEGGPIQDVRGDLVVPVFEDVHAHVDDFAEQALDRIATAVELGRETLDDEAGKFFAGRVHALFEQTPLPASAPDFPAEFAPRVFPAGFGGFVTAAARAA